MAKVVGIGGVFLKFKGDEKELLKWYEEKLGLKVSDYGANFYEGTELALLTFKRTENSTGAYLNLRVDDMDEIMNMLTQDGIKVIDPVKVFPYGKFSTIEDPFGNPLELWEPNQDEYIKMIEEEMIKK